MRVIRFFFPLVVLAIFLSIGAMTKAVAKPARSRRVLTVTPTPYKVTGVVQGVTDSRLFIKTAAGIEHMIKIDSRTTLLDPDGRAQSVSPFTLLKGGEMVEVELDRRDLVKSALTVILPPQMLVKK